MFHEDSSYSGDSYSKYTSHPANKHDDSKLQEKYKQLVTQGAPPPPKNDPYRFTRSTLQKTPQGASQPLDKQRMADLSSKYRYVYLDIHVPVYMYFTVVFLNSNLFYGNYYVAMLCFVMETNRQEFYHCVRHYSHKKDASFEI